MAKKTSEIINNIQHRKCIFCEEIKESVINLIDLHFNPNNQDEVSFAFNDFVLLCLRKSRGGCFASFDFQRALWITYNKEFNEVAVCDEERRFIEYIEYLPISEAIEIFTAIVEVIKNN